MHLFYITDLFPEVSQVFISRELAGLEKLGAEITLLSLQKPQNSIVHALNGQLRTRCFWGPELAVAKVEKGLSHLSAFISRPKTYLATAICSQTAGLPPLRHPFRQLPLYARLIQESGAQRIHCHFGRQGMLVGWLASHLLGLPFSVTLHGSDVMVSPYMNLGTVLADADLIICVSEKIRALVQQSYRIDPQKLAVVRCGVSLSDYQLAPKLPGILKILCVARLHPIKGIDDLVTACSLLRDRQVKFECLIVGDGAMRQALQDQVEYLGLRSSIRFAGAVPNEKLPEIYAQSSLVVLPSHSEGLSVVLLEAMASGLPVVATNVGGIPELVISGENGQLVDPCQPKSLADAIQKIACLSLAEKEEIGRKNRQKVQESFNFTPETGKLYELFKKNNIPRREKLGHENGFFDMPHGGV
jgi:glycosyltransferase involved in cell wall biosynthesis